jgi:DNA-binding transcriptional regulator YiaG
MLTDKELTKVWVETAKAAEDGDTKAWISLMEILDSEGWLTTDQKNVLIKTRLKAARENAKLTQQAMSDLLGIPKRTIERWEAGSRIPAPWVERLITEKLGSMKSKR